MKKKCVVHFTKIENKTPSEAIKQRQSSRVTLWGFDWFVMRIWTHDSRDFPYLSSLVFGLYNPSDVLRHHYRNTRKTFGCCKVPLKVRMFGYLRSLWVFGLRVSNSTRVLFRILILEWKEWSEPFWFFIYRIRNSDGQISVLLLLGVCPVYKTNFVSHLD